MNMSKYHCFSHISSTVNITSKKMTFTLCCPTL